MGRLVSRFRHSEFMRAMPHVPFGVRLIPKLPSTNWRAIMRVQAVTSRVAISFAFAAAAGCAASTVWVKPGGTEYDFESDKSACLAQVQGAYAGVDPLELAFMGGGMLANCMRGKGWRQQAANVQSPQSRTTSAPPSSEPKCESTNSTPIACDSPTATTMRLGGREYRRTSSGWEPTDEKKVSASSPAKPAAGCSKDTDCKGDRVCENGRCIDHH